MLRKIKDGIIKVFSFLWISAMCLIGVAPVDDAGAGMNGFLVLGLWILCIFIMIKIKPWIAVAGSSLVVSAVAIDNHNSGMTWADFLEKIEIPLGTVIIVLVLAKLIFGSVKEWEDESDAIVERKKDAKKKGKACCPWCGSVSIQYYPLGIPYQRYADYPIERSNHKYHCNRCGREW